PAGRARYFAKSAGRPFLLSIMTQGGRDVKSPLLAGFVAVAVCAGGYFLGRARTTPRDRGLERLKGAGDDLAGSISKGAPSGGRHPPRVLAPRPDEPAASRPSYENPPGITSRQAAPSAPAFSLKDQRDYLQTEFSRETVDANWARDATRQAREAFSP